MEEAGEAGKGRRGQALLLAAAAAFLFFVLYARTACPGAYWQDSGIYARSVCLLGNCYPPGYPVYLCAANLFTALPACDAVAGLNLFSAVAGAAAAFFVVLLARRLCPANGWGAVGAAVAAFALGTAPAVWAQATVAEVYTLSLALSAASAYLLVRWGGGPDGRPLLAAAFVYGLACGVHPQQAAFLPAYVAYVLWAGGRRVLSWRLICAAAAAFALAFSAYLYLPVRSAAGVAADWGKPDTLKNFLYHVTGRMYGRELFSASAALVGARGGLAAGLFHSQFGWVGLGVGAVGAVWLFVRRLKPAVLVFGAAAAAALFILNYYSANWRTWYVALYMAWALACGAGAAWLCGKVAAWRRPAGAVLAAVALVAASLPPASRFGPADRSYYPYADDAAGNVLRLVGPRATFITSYEGSALVGPMAALVTARHARPDVYFVDAAGTRLFNDFFELMAAEDRNAAGDVPPDRYVEAFLALVGDRSRDYYMLYPFEPLRRYGYAYEKRGRGWRLVPPEGRTASRDWWALYRRRGVEPEPPAYVDYWAGTVLASQYVDESRDRRREGDEGRAAFCLATAEYLGRRSENAQNNLGAYAETRGDLGDAVRHYRRAVALDPTFRKGRENLARAYEATGDETRAAEEAAALSTLYPDDE
jgi:tetratricopeptide (TPR) repeat protein